MSEPAKKPELQPESYQPKKPEMMQALEQAQGQGQQAQAVPLAIKTAPATIKAKARDQVRIIELPACKMVTSGPVKGDEAWKPGGIMERFDTWWVSYDNQRADAFYPRDFLWSPPEGGLEWGYAVLEVPRSADGSVDTGGFGVIDFPGGLYAVAISVDGDGKDHDRVYSGIQEWVRKSGCFALDETETRRSLGNITSPKCAREVMGFHQMDLYFPIRIKGEDEQ